MTTRRQWIAAAALVLVAPRAAGQGTHRVAKIGVLRWDSGALDEMRERLPAAFLLRGYVEGRNVAFLWRTAEENTARADEIVREFVRERVDVIIASPTPAAHAARRGTATIPIVLGAVADPIASGLVTNLARPGGNITGLSMNLPEVAGKRVELLNDAFPGMKRVAFLGSVPDPATKVFVANTERAARRFGMSLHTELVSGSSEFEAAFGRIAAAGSQAVIVQPIFWRLSRPILDLALKHRLPTVSDFASFARDGGLLSYGPNRSANEALVVDYVDRILKGANPGDLPIQEPTRFELLVNLRTAKSLGSRYRPLCSTARTK